MKDSLETRGVLLIFYLELGISGVVVQSIHKKPPKNGKFSEELLSENESDAVLATFYCCDHGAKASEAVQKIATEEKEYRKHSLCVKTC